jgi:cell division protein FtsQ
VAGTAPLELRRRLEGFREGGERGLTVAVRGGPVLIFGDATRVRAKWTAAARVLADPSSRGATYIDLRLPDRPAAGGVAADTLAPLDTAGGAEGSAPAAPAAPDTQPAPTPAPAQPASPAPVQPQAPATQAPAAPPQGTCGGATPNPQP